MVRTVLAVRSQSTPGTLKPGSSAVFSAISESAAASSRKSISSSTDRASVSTIGDRAQAARRRMEALREPGDEIEAFQIALEPAGRHRAAAP
jgi:hypothetical protein